ncbi:MAG TPA: hypothetical protein PLN96_04025 [Zoogloea sp.]|uniref:hypothetical protein n=1 Tax=Zoogloea sp. TaxID=49181 RepID=UPI002BE686D8|nr:hypothetical protein [Zoogloea sp.]HMV19057.1 hypothetical protein [Rhodocyclaceae bacterium]HMV63741.1 hypothetical protein [Rhodocyclaceae bacterium]HMW52021.1 hypothetical protein [Rhodocyclaceae bacterium]HMY50797.1 hypothetical protein [Rhodocyclaceae bacterium]HMZ76715.1 hypothetical protein [Rhodocyclaceae bacterium]
MRGIQNTPQEPKWALPGKWDWSVRLSLVSSVALCAGMLYGSSVGHQGARPRLESTSCLPDRHDVDRLIGPAAWTSVTDCVLLPRDTSH